MREVLPGQNDRGAKSKRRAVVVGGGVIGCATAYYLAELGWNVTILEANRLGGGCSHGNCGFICPSHVLPLPMPGVIGKVLRSAFRRDSPIYLKPRYDPALWAWLYRFAQYCRSDGMMAAAQARHALLTASNTLYQELMERERLHCEWQQRGLLIAFATQKDFDRHGSVVQLLNERFGVTASRFIGPELTELEPALKPGLAGGWHYTGDSHLRPDKLMAELGRVLRRKGVAIEEGVAVYEVAVENRRAIGVQTAAGFRPAEAVVVAAGAQTPALRRSLGCKLPIQPGKGYSLTFRRPALAPQIPIIFDESHVAITPFEGTLRVGSTMEFAGYDRKLNPRRINVLLRAAARHLVEPLNEPVDEQWFGWRPLTFDDLPCIGPAPSAANLVVAAGNGMIGVATATGTGKLAAQMAAGEPLHLDPAPYSLQRFLSN